jgi:hypothetical protein
MDVHSQQNQQIHNNQNLAKCLKHTFEADLNAIRIRCNK